MSCQSETKILKLKRHDTMPYAKMRLVEKNVDSPGQEVAVDVSSSTITFNMVTDDDARILKVDSGACVITDGPNGQFEYRWDAADTDTDGDYLGEAQIVFPSGGKLTVPGDDSFKIRIFKDYNDA